MHVCTGIISELSIMDYEGYALSYALRGVPASCLYNFGGLRVVFKSYGLI